MNTTEINKRYSELAETECCLSCGGAIKYSDVKEGEICVDLGSGRGTDVIRLAEKVGKSGFVFGIDVSDGMIKKAERYAEKLGVDNVKFIKSDLEKLDIENDSVDLIISNCTINHVKDKNNLWNEVYRILKPNGRFVVSDIYSIEEVPDEYKTDPAAVSECWAGSVTKLEYINTLNKCGFKNINIIEESKPYEKGKIKVASFTIAGMKSSNCCCQ